MGYYIAGISTFTYRYHDVILSLSEHHTNNHYLVRDQLFFFSINFFASDSL